jgi:acyl carrier protein
MKTALRQLLSECAHLDVPLDQLGDSDNLFDAGLQSQAAVHLLIAIEDEFGVAIPDHMLTRSLFTSVDSLAAAISELPHTRSDP